MSRSIVAIVSTFILTPAWLCAQTPYGIAETSFDCPQPEFARSLSKSQNFKGFDDARMNFATALEALADQYDVAIILDERAFELVGIKNIRAQQVARKPIPKIERATAVEALKVVLARLPDKAQPICLPRRDYLLITTLPMGVRELRSAGRSLSFHSRDMGCQLTRSILIPVDPLAIRHLDESLYEVVRTWSVCRITAEVVAEAATRAPVAK